MGRYGEVKSVYLGKFKSRVHHNVTVICIPADREPRNGPIEPNNTYRPLHNGIRMHKPERR